MEQVLVALTGDVQADGNAVTSQGQRDGGGAGAEVKKKKSKKKGRPESEQPLPAAAGDSAPAGGAGRADRVAAASGIDEDAKLRREFQEAFSDPKQPPPQGS